MGRKKSLRERISSRVFLAHRFFILVFLLALTILIQMENLSLLKWSRGLRSFIYFKMWQLCKTCVDLRGEPFLIQQYRKIVPSLLLENSPPILEPSGEPFWGGCPILSVSKLGENFGLRYLVENLAHFLSNKINFSWTSLSWWLSSSQTVLFVTGCPQLLPLWSPLQWMKPLWGFLMDPLLEWWVWTTF